MGTATRRHWDGVYETKTEDSVSWFQNEPTISLDLLAAANVTVDMPIIDVGGGASRLVDQLLAGGFSDLSVLDVSSRALDLTSRRLGDRAAAVQWLVEDAAAWTPLPGRYGAWHDRAVFHFMTTPAARDGYLRALDRGLRVGGHLILATFALDGPERCSGLPVQRYSPETLQAVLGARYQLGAARQEAHLTPGGARQDFVWCCFRKIREADKGEACT